MLRSRSRPWADGMQHSRAGTELPVNFERIRLSKLQIEKLRALGIEYHQDDGRDV